EFTNWYPAFLPFAYGHADELVEIRKRVLRKFYLRPRYVWRRVRTIRSAADVLRFGGLLLDFLVVLGRAGGEAAAERRAARVQAWKERYVPAPTTRPVASTR